MAATGMHADAVRPMMDDFLTLVADTPGSTIADIGQLIEAHLLPAYEAMVREQVAKEIEALAAEQRQIIAAETARGENR